MVDNLLKKELLINSEAFFVSNINTDQLNDCLAIEQSAEKTRSIRTQKEFTDLLNKYTCYGLFKENTMLAYAFFAVTIDEAELLDINLLKNQQANGLGSAFLAQCINTINKNIILEVATDNIQAIKAYKKFNCQQIGIRKNYYKNIDATKTDALVLKISL